MTRARDRLGAGAGTRADALVDGRNVQRSTWPNIPGDVLVEGLRAWARREGVRPLIVFDGRAPGGVEGVAELDDGAIVVGTGRGSADDWIARAAEERRLSGTPYWLVTSDRGLRARAGPGAERTIGGGTLARELARRR